LGSETSRTDRAAAAEVNYTVFGTLYNTKALRDSTRSGALLKRLPATGIPMKVETC
jgi:hypothetical protein